MKQVTVAIVGCGSRGLDTYAACQERFPEKMKIVAAADIRPEKLRQMRERHGLSEEQCYASAEEMFAHGRLADMVCICTPDNLHYAHAMAALRLDYHLLLEKPIAQTVQQCKDIEALAKERHRHVTVCHVLRYTVFYQKLKELIDAGRVGEVVSIQADEQVGHWHQAHSFVRGNWRRAEDTTPMILAKCCHDMDILLWLSGRHCERVSSFGGLRHFKKEFAPQGAPLRCTDGCPVQDTCPYNAIRFYMSRFNSGKRGWPVCIITPEPSEESIMEALRTGPYGRCVYHCDNDVVDHQVVNLELEDGATVSFSMCGFSDRNTRTILIMGTHGEIWGELEEKVIKVTTFGQKQEVIDVSKLTNDFSGHSGGDARMLEDLLDLIAGEKAENDMLTNITASVESHLVALAAEESRVAHGRVIELKK